MVRGYRLLTQHTLGRRDSFRRAAINFAGLPQGAGRRRKKRFNFMMLASAMQYFQMKGNGGG